MKVIFADGSFLCWSVLSTKTLQTVRGIGETVGFMSAVTSDSCTGEFNVWHCGVQQTCFCERLRGVHDLFALGAILDQCRQGRN